VGRRCGDVGSGSPHHCRSGDSPGPEGLLVAPCPASCAARAGRQTYDFTWSAGGAEMDTGSSHFEADISTVTVEPPGIDRTAVSPAR